MRRYIVSLTSFAIAGLLFSQVATAQDKEKDKEKTKSGNEEIIIKRKTGKDAKVTIEIKGNDVLVNGKPVDDYSDDDISVRKRKSVTVLTPGSPFRGQSGGVWNADNDFFYSEDVAFLGVVTEKTSKGAKIEEVTKESAASKSGLKEGDVITKIDETKIEDPDDLTKAIRKHKPEEKATITYERDGKENKLTVTLGKRKNTAAYGFTTPSPRLDAFDWHEGQLGNLFSYGGKARLGIRAQDTEDGKGVKVLNVEDESAAEKAGLKDDDIITEFDGVKVNSADDLSKAAKEAKDKISVKVAITRDGKAQTLEIKTPRKLKTTNL